MKALLLFFLAACLVGCFPERFTKALVGSLTNHGEPGYWRLVEYQRKGKLENGGIPEKTLLEVEEFLSEKDSLLGPVYSKGVPYQKFSFYDSLLNKKDSIQAVRRDHRYDRKYKTSQYWYQINAESGFAAFLDAIPDGDGETYRIELSNVMKSATYKPELDSLRYIYEPTAKFR
ncbi:hypothetical protein [Dyadobacter sp. CY343]|uniref:hypothetical protein n=1 Tax=Dyadobacter sp. CY343 TaxID=2907299 RepID=UPI001F22C6E0|nr:hypothetical protein [Dyadobacter sp. CY343]MCE7060535.1 hypothetical protein [Dyadobacter sp. CY343]